jgi:hypothetical protein
MFDLEIERNKRKPKNKKRAHEEKKTAWRDFCFSSEQESKFNSTRTKSKKKCIIL